MTEEERDVTKLENWSEIFKDRRYRYYLPKSDWFYELFLYDDDMATVCLMNHLCSRTIFTFMPLGYGLLLVKEHCDNEAPRYMKRKGYYDSDL